MGRPRETFNKKEREKRKQQKRNEKLQRKEQRKANSEQGKSFDDMLAYVDEHGNISSTPPDPSKKEVIKAEDIDVSTPPSGKRAPGTTRTGKVHFFNEDKGYGFIEDADTGERIFVHVSNLTEPIAENDRVSFDTRHDVRGLSAYNVKHLV